METGGYFREFFHLLVLESMYIVARRKILFYDGHTALNIILFSGDYPLDFGSKSRVFDPISHLLVLDLGSKMVVFDGFEHEL